jgi:hypothetical protein
VSQRTGHAPLNKHLHCIRKTESSHCPHRLRIQETVHHFLLSCPFYRRERNILINVLGRKASSISYLLTDPNATPHLVRYVNVSGRLKTTPGEVPLPHKPPDWWCPVYRAKTRLQVNNVKIIPSPASLYYHPSHQNVPPPHPSTQNPQLEGDRTHQTPSPSNHQTYCLQLDSCIYGFSYL